MHSKTSRSIESFWTGATCPPSLPLVLALAHACASNVCAAERGGVLQLFCSVSLYCTACREETICAELVTSLQRRQAGCRTLLGVLEFVWTIHGRAATTCTSMIT